MSVLDKARDTQLRNIQAKTGKSLDQIRALIGQSGLSRHGEIRQMLIDQLGLGYGDANALAHYALQSDGQSAAQAKALSTDEVVQALYAGREPSLRSIHDRLMTAIQKFGAFEIVPKKGYVSLRRKKQFAMLGPASKGRVEVGLNLKGVEATARLESQPAGGMCQYKVHLTKEAEVDVDLIGWLKLTYDGSG
jgi:Domain of unknown function (DUF5655)/Domain of unknown function (DUF4287)